MDQRVYQIALNILNGLGPTGAKQLLHHFGELEDIFNSSTKSLRKIEGVRSNSLGKLERDQAIERAKQEVEFIEANNLQLYFYQDLNFPTALKECPDGPIILFSLGTVDFNQKNIAVVGTRKHTAYGKKMAEELISDLAPQKVQIVSGLAHGIDKIAHEAALKNDLQTIAVLGHGLDTIYPAAHRSLAKEITNNGGLVTEFISGVVGDPGNFPRRNRIVAGLSEVTVVVESSETGGSMITANLANDYNREVFAFPGQADKTSSQGCNNLIKRQKAHLISSSEDLINVMGWDNLEKVEKVNLDLLNNLTEEETKLMELFQEQKSLDVDSIATASNLNASQINIHLFNLEMKGTIKSLPGKRFCLA